MYLAVHAPREKSNRGGGRPRAPGRVGQSVLAVAKKSVVRVAPFSRKKGRRTILPGAGGETMSRVRWFWALAGLFLAALAAPGQEAPSDTIATTRTVRAVSALSGGAVMGRPVTAIPAPGAPARLPTGLRAVEDGPILPPVGNEALPEPGEIIATGTSPSAHPPAAAIQVPARGDGGAEFASDRRPHPQPPVRLVGVDSTPPGPKAGPAEGPAMQMRDVPGHTFWAGTYPVKPPPAPFAPPDGPQVVDVSSSRYYFGGEYLLWWTKADRAPPLVTTGTPYSIAGPRVDPLTPPSGSLDTRILQDGRLDHGTRGGFRLTAGYFLDDCTGKAIELSGFFLPQGSSRFSADQNQFPVLTRPFFDTVLGRENVQIVAFPGLQNGRITVNAPSELWGLEANLICKACCGGDCGKEWRVNWLVGPRYLNLRESLTVTEDITFTNRNDPLFGSRLLVTDRFATSNQFYGAQVGAEGRWLIGRLTLDARARVAFGVTSQNLTVEGTQTFLVGVNPDPRPGGLLALPSNIGSFSSTRFSVVPEIGGSVGYYVTDWLRLSVGYNFLYWSSVVRPGDQIDRNLNSNQIPGFNVPIVLSTDPPPRRLFSPTDYWAHGLTFGAEVHF